MIIVRLSSALVKRLSSRKPRRERTTFDVCLPAAIERDSQVF